MWSKAAIVVSLPSFEQPYLPKEAKERERAAAVFELEKSLEEGRAVSSRCHVFFQMERPIRCCYVSLACRAAHGKSSSRPPRLSLEKVLLCAVKRCTLAKGPPSSLLYRCLRWSQQFAKREAEILARVETDRISRLAAGEAACDEGDRTARGVPRRACARRTTGAKPTPAITVRKSCSCAVFRWPTTRVQIVL